MCQQSDRDSGAYTLENTANLLIAGRNFRRTKSNELYTGPRMPIDGPEGQRLMTDIISRLPQDWVTFASDLLAL